MRIIEDFISLFFPRYCLACSVALVKGEETLCTRCIFNLPKTNYDIEDNLVKDRLLGRLPLRYAVAFLKFKKRGHVQRLLHELKYNHHPEIGVKLGKVLGKELKERGLESAFDLIIPVPLHDTRKRKRGYNQSAKFAEGLSYALGVPWDESISIRQKKTATQTNRSRGQRWENVKDVFSISPTSTLKGSRVLLVDDVITTGATLEACGMHLIGSGCRELSIGCIADAQ